ncbi:MAG TPA: hypothetical protein VK866_09850 [Acidimicrobiales bacterium]|nr:hypothetical protein [Acidimicrobiales bacterium]
MAEGDDLLRRREKVVAAVDLRGVPAGTRGKVALVNGLGPWIRYRVLFDNGADVGNILRDELVRRSEWQGPPAAGETDRSVTI